MTDDTCPLIDPLWLVKAFAATHDRERLRQPSRNRNEQVLDALLCSAAAFRDWLHARDAPATIGELIALMPSSRWRVRASDRSFATLIIHVGPYGIWQLSAHAHERHAPGHEHLSSDQAGVTYAEASIDILGSRTELGSRSQLRYHPADPGQHYAIYIAGGGTCHTVRGVAETGSSLAIFLSFHAAAVLPP